MNAPIDVLAVIDNFIDPDKTPGQPYDLTEARAVVADLIEAAQAWNRWDYEVMSAKVNGESVYSFNELSALREFARGLTESTLIKIFVGER